jgi:peptide deformylase
MDKRSKLKIVRFPDPVLFVPCTEVSVFDKKLHKILDEMIEIMQTNNGMGLAANQVGISKRFFVMIDNRKKIHDFINPIITEYEGESDLPEGCLSLSGHYIKCKRADTVTIRAQNRFGEYFTVIAYGIESVCIQHEIDHLNGIFFTSKEIK